MYDLSNWTWLKYVTHPVYIYKTQNKKSRVFYKIIDKRLDEERKFTIHSVRGYEQCSGVRELEIIDYSENFRTENYGVVLVKVFSHASTLSRDVASTKAGLNNNFLRLNDLRMIAVSSELRQLNCIEMKIVIAQLCELRLSEF